MNNLKDIYLIFCGEDYEEAGGASDYLTFATTIEQATQIANDIIGEPIEDVLGNRTHRVEWSHVMDAQSGQIVKAFSYKIIDDTCLPEPIDIMNCRQAITMVSNQPVAKWKRNKMTNHEEN